MMKLRTIVLLAAWLLAWTIPSLAVEISHLQFHGFSFVTATKQEYIQSRGVERGHTWLIFKAPLDSAGTRNLLAILAPEGPPHLLHNLQIEWQTPTWAVIHKVTVGKFVPPFGDEFSSWRPDEIETIYYSRVMDASRLVARDTGMQISSRFFGLPGTAGKIRFGFDAALFAGLRTGGEIPLSGEGVPDIYLRGNLYHKGSIGSTPAYYQLGMSHRSGPINATAINAYWQWLDRCTITTEGIWIHRGFDFYILGAIWYKKKAAMVYRYENFYGISYHTPGLKMRLDNNFFIKINLVTGGHPHPIIWQAGFQF